MGRGSQFYWALTAKAMPDDYEKRMFYSHLDLYGKNGADMVKFRRERAKWKRQQAKKRGHHDQSLPGMPEDKGRHPL